MYSKTIFLFIIFICLTSCTKEQEVQVVDIKVSFSDDVVPVRTIFHVDEVIGDTRWHINDSTYIGFYGFPEENPVFDNVLNEPGDYDISLTSQSIDGKTDIIGETSFSLRDTANRLRIESIDFKDLQFDTSRDSLALDYHYVINSETAFLRRTMVSSKDLENVFSLPDPLILELPNFDDITESFYLNISINEINSSTILYRKIFYIKSSYFGERVYEDSSKGMIYDDISFNLDWYRE